MSKQDRNALEQAEALKTPVELNDDALEPIAGGIDQGWNLEFVLVRRDGAP